MAEAQNWWESAPIVATPEQSQGGAIYVPPAPEKPNLPSPTRETERWRVMTPDEIKREGLQEGQRYQINEAGKIEPITSKELGESESKAIGFYQRMRSSDVQLNRLGLDPQGFSTLIAQRLSPTFSRQALSDERRAQLDAMENFIAASLRLESGAAIGPAEFEKQARIFFPQPGAGQNEIETKRQQRELAILGFKAVAGEQGARRADENLRSLGFVNENGLPVLTVTVTPEQSIERFGQLTYDENGQLVGDGYSGTAYNADGSERGLVGSVSDETLQKPAPSFFGSAIGAVTGADQSTETTRNLPDWVNMPGINNLLSSAAWKTGLGTAFGGSPQEIAQIVQSNFPGTQVWQDEKGNYILRSAQDGKDYAIKPGFQVSDIPRAGNIIGLGLLGGGGVGATALRTGATEAALQAGVETTQAATGGTFNPSDIAAAGAFGAAGQKAADLLPSVVQRVRGQGGGPMGGGPSGGAPVVPPMGGGPRIARGTEMGGGMPPSGGVPGGAAPTVGAPIDQAAMQAADETFIPQTVRFGDAGSAASTGSNIRASRAQELPVPIELARFQRSRLFEEQQRARELAKNNEVGGPIRERLAEQQEALRQNFDRFIDETGSEVWENAREKGVVVDQALKKLADVGKTRIRVLYKRAEKAGELAEPVDYAPIKAFIEEQDATTRQKLAPVLDAVANQLTKNDPNNTGAIPINALESVRKLINKVAQPGTPDATFGAELKDLIDTATEGKGGDLYQQARAARIQYRKTFEDAGLVKKLMGTKPGTTDRQVALEKVAEQAIYSGGTALDDIKALKGVLDQASARGERAWRELQGATLEHIRDQAYKGITTDQSGQRVLNAKNLDTVITNLDRSGKLDYVLGRQTANLLRTINDVAKDVVTAPPGSVNASNTSSAAMNAMDTLATWGLTSMPIPAGKLLSGFRSTLQNRELRKEVKRLLD